MAASPSSPSSSSPSRWLGLCACCQFDLQPYVYNQLFASIVAIPGQDCTCLDGLTVSLIRDPGGANYPVYWRSGNVLPGSCGAGNPSPLLNLTFFCPPGGLTPPGLLGLPDFQLTVRCNTTGYSQTVSPGTPRYCSQLNAPGVPVPQLFVPFNNVNLADPVGVPCCVGVVNILVTS